MTPRSSSVISRSVLPHSEDMNFRSTHAFSPMDSANASLAVSTLSTGSGLRIVRLVKISALRLSFPSSSSISKEDSKL